jgi:exopolysaccharide biosynthesis polyprenyl glycosylphosphotransferase
MKPTHDLRPAPLLRDAEARARHLQAGELAGLGVSGHPDAARRSYLIHRLLLGSDLLALALAYGVMIAANVLYDRAAVDQENLLAFAATLPIWVLLSSVLGLYHLYERRVDHTFADELIPVFLVTTVWAWFFLGVNSGLDQGLTELFGPGVLWGAAIVAVLFARALARQLATRRAWFRQPVMLVGARDDIDRVLARIDRHPECGLDPTFALRVERGRTSLHHLDGRPDHLIGAPEAAPGRNLLPEEMAAWVRELGIDRVIVAGWASGLGERTELIRALTSAVISVDVVAAEPEALLSTATLHHLEGLPILTIRPTAITQGSRILKRALDLLVAAAGLSLLSPLLAYIAIRIKVDSPGPVLFRQQRAGQYGQPFELLKFRTMVDGAEAMQDELRPRSLGNGSVLFKLREDPRATKFGARMRRWSLDELPQLWNVVRGDMSMVGPRPLPLDEAAQVDSDFVERTRVRPGITGPWQIHGRSDIPFDEMLQLDYTYVAAWTMREDLRLLARTFSAVVHRRGAY